MRLVTNDARFYISFPSDDKLYTWYEELYTRIPHDISYPTDFEHRVHVDYDEDTNSYVGVPDEWLNADGEEAELIGLIPEAADADGVAVIDEDGVRFEMVDPNVWFSSQY